MMDKEANVPRSVLSVGLGLVHNNSKRRRELKTLNAKPKGQRNRFVQFYHSQQSPDLL